MRRVGIVAGGALVLMFMSSAVDAATNTFSVVNSGISAYLINGQANPNLKLVRGFFYTFQVNAPGHPFWIKTVQGTGTANGYTNGVVGNGTPVGTVTFQVPTNAPTLLFYNCEIHAPMTGQLNIEDPPSVSLLAFDLGTNLVFRSTGTDALNIRIVESSDLAAGNWSNVAASANAYSQGTNSTSIEVPSESAAFFRIEQSLP